MVVDMASYNNAAGRLYLLLERLREIDGGTPIAEAWAQIFGESRELVRERLGAVAELVGQIERAVGVPGREQLTAPVARYRAQWLEATFPLQRSFGEPVSTVRPSDEAHEALGVVAAYLEAVAPDGMVPPEAERTALTQRLQALIEDVGRDEELPAEIAHLLVRRLADIEVALRHIEIGGPEAIRKASEALMGAAVVSTVASERTRTAGVTKRVMAVAASIYVAFSAGPTIQKSLEAWPQIAHELVAGSQYFVSPTPSPDTDAEGTTEHRAAASSGHEE
jgi:hypothetical protein